MRNLTVGVARQAMRLLRCDERAERGAIAVIVAVLLGCGVLTGIGALVIDVGQIYQNRAELQNGADAAALAVAKSCADGSCQVAIAGGYADANASKLTGGQAGIPLVCGSGALGQCPPPTGNKDDCPAAPSGLANYVDVHTRTQTPGGTLLPPVFGRTLLGNATYNGATVRACAQAAWGPALVANSLDFTISICQWNALTAGGGNPFGTEIALLINGSAKPCSLPSGLVIPGGFGWLSSSGGCTATIDLTTLQTYTDPGVNLPPGCKTVIQQDVASHAVVYVPVFDSDSGTGKGVQYHLAGLAAFELNGYQNLPGMNPDVVPGGMSGACGNSKCLFGYFTQQLVPVSDVIGTGTNFGATEIKLTG